MEEIENIGITTVVGYRSNLSGETFLEEKEAILSDRSIRQEFGSRLIERELNSYLFNDLKLNISEQISEARKLKEKSRFNKLTDLQEIVYNPSTKNRSNQYISKSALEIAVEMEILFNAIADASDVVNKAYNNDKEISLLYQRSKKGKEEKESIGEDELPAAPARG
jgi:hypothetical protein